MAKFKVVGNHMVDGVKPGGTVEVDDERGRKLQRAGHLEPVPVKVPKLDRKDGATGGDSLAG